MKLVRRRFLRLTAGAAALPALTRMASALTYPTRPVRLLVPFPAGGGPDVAARLLANWLSDRLGQSFVVEDRPGAGGTLATEAVVRAAPDGYTLLVVDNAAAINPTLYSRLNFNFIRDIAPVAGIALQPFIMVVNPAFSAPPQIAPQRAVPLCSPASQLLWQGQTSRVRASSATAPHLPDAGRQRQPRSGQTRDLPASDAILLHVRWP